jgi:hypothetical protein
VFLTEFTSLYNIKIYPVCRCVKVCVVHVATVVLYWVQLKHAHRQDSLYYGSHHAPAISTNFSFHPSVLRRTPINRSIIYVSTFILTNNNWTTCFDRYSVILRSFSMTVSYRELCAHWDPKCVYIKT